MEKKETKLIEYIELDNVPTQSAAASVRDWSSIELVREDFRGGLDLILTKNEGITGLYLGHYVEPETVAEVGCEVRALTEREVLIAELGDLSLVIADQKVSYQTLWEELDSKSTLLNSIRRNRTRRNFSSRVRRHRAVITHLSGQSVRPHRRSSREADSIKRIINE